MSCYHPLKAWPVGVNPSGKTQYKITDYQVDHLEFRNGTWIPCRSSDLGLYRERSLHEFVTIPCGNCVGCRLDYSRQWANRCLLEMQYHDSAYFVTLTYNDLHVPRSDYVDVSTGELVPALTLRKRDFQLFMKRLRKRFTDQKIRFFAAGEYGSTTFRPHYHAILFGLKLDDLQFYKNQRGYNYYISQSLQECWSVREKVKGVLSPLTPLGFVVVGQVTWETCAYTARYVMKKLKGPEADFYANHNVEPPFTLMSRKPGIARQWYEDHPDCYDYEYINVSTPTGGKKFRPPRYFDQLFDLDHPDESREMKELRRKLAEEATAAKLQQTDLSYLDYLQVEENNLVNRIKSLKRSVF